MANSQYYSIFTTQGLALLREAIQNGTKLGITTMSFGDGNGSVPEPSASYIKLVREVYRTQLNRLAPSPNNPNWLEADAVIPSAIGGFNIREVGLWAGNTLVAYANYPATYKPSADQGTAQIKTIRIVLQIDNTANFELKIDASVVMATIQSVEDAKIEAIQYADEMKVHHVENISDLEQSEESQKFKNNKVLIAASGLSNKAFYRFNSTNNEFERVIFDSTVLDARQFGIIENSTADQYLAVQKCNIAVNTLPFSDKAVVILKLPMGHIKSSVGFSFDRETILISDESSLFEYTGNGGYALKMGKDNITTVEGSQLTYGVKGVSFTGATNAKHGIYISQYVKAPTFSKVEFLDFGNPVDANSWCVFLQGHNWDINFLDCKLHNVVKNHINVIRANGILLDGTPDNGNSRINLIDCFFNHGATATAGVGVYMNCFKGRIQGGGFQGFKHSVQFGKHSQYCEISGAYFETIYQGNESIFKLGDDGQDDEISINALTLDKIYVNLHNENNEYGNTDTKFLIAAQNTKVTNLKLGEISTFNGIKHPLLNLNKIEGQSCKVGDLTHNNPYLHNLTDDEMVVENPSYNYIPNSDLLMWQRGSSFTHTTGVTKIADGFSILSDNSTGSLSVYNEPINAQYELPLTARGLLRIVKDHNFNGTYLTLRVRIGDLEVLAGKNANFSFLCKANHKTPITATLVRNYGNSSEYISIGAFEIKESYTMETYAKFVIMPQLDKAKVKERASRTYVDISLPLDGLYVLDLSCFTLQQGILRSGWEPRSYIDETQHASLFYQSGIYSVINTGQRQIQIDFKNEMRFTPVFNANVVYQDAPVNYVAENIIVTQKQCNFKLNAIAEDVAVNWIADAEIT